MRARLPAYMTPAYLERLPFIPTLVSNKADRKLLPPPKSARLRLNDAVVPPETETERELCQALQGVLGLEAVSIDADIFTEYGAHSLLMARFCARVRQLDPSLQVAMRDVYANPTIRRLARALDAEKPAETEELDVGPAHRPSNFAYYACGAAQTAFYAVLGALAVAAVQAAFNWVYEDVDSPASLYGRALAVAISWFVGHNALAILGKWLLVGRVRAGAIPLWSVRYFRFWAAKALVRSAPALAFAGTPLYNLYLRLLGAKIGRNAVIVSRLVPAVTADLFEVGEDALVTRGALAPGYAAYGNRIHFDAIRIGRNAYVGEQSLLEIGSAIGDFGQLGHASSLQRGHRVPDGKRYAGSPAEETTTNFRLADEAPARPLRRALFTATRLAFVISVAGALADGIIFYLMGALTEGDDALALKPWDATFAVLPLAAGTALAVTIGALIVGLLAIFAVPRLANLLLNEGKVYPLYGFRHGMQQIVESASNSRFFNLMFGDSIFIEFLPALGRLEARPRRRDGLELRQRAGSGQSVPLLGRREHGGLRRPVARRPDDVEPRLPAWPMPHRREQLPRHHDLRAARRPHRRQRDVRLQGHGADRWARARERRPAWLARLRDPARIRARPRDAGRHRHRRSASAASSARPGSTSPRCWA